MIRVIELKGGVTIRVNEYGRVYLSQDEDIVGPFDKSTLNGLIGELLKITQNKTEQ
jgi:hypothetical protein